MIFIFKEIIKIKIISGKIIFCVENFLYSPFLSKSRNPVFWEFGVIIVHIWSCHHIFSLLNIERSMSHIYTETPIWSRHICYRETQYYMEHVITVTITFINFRAMDIRYWLNYGWKNINNHNDGNFNHDDDDDYNADVDNEDDNDNVVSPDWVSVRHLPMTQGFTHALAPRWMFRHDDDNHDDDHDYEDDHDHEEEDEMRMIIFITIIMMKMIIVLVMTIAIKVIVLFVIIIILQQRLFQVLSSLSSSS